ncbi:MAG: DUF2703 domain-containing protein [Candidatus Omnitrophota bacterium]|nr:MAG: DUF2703 domain-containing protein [Candidatus Omnitrophota bacterium]
MKVLKIKWQRLVSHEDMTCQRCRATGSEVHKAVEKLRRSLGPLGVKVVLEEKVLTPDACSKDISQSNRIWIAGKPLEEWFGAKVGKSPCSTCCGELKKDVECRTVEIGGKVYETIPEVFIIQAGLLAAIEIIKS